MPIPVPEDLQGPRVLLSDLAFNQLLTAIHDGTLIPGERLNDQGLTAWLKVSRTPIREALGKLEAIGLIETAANRYTKVATPTKPRLVESIDLLISYGELAARLAIADLDSSDVDALTAALDELVATEDGDPGAAVAALSSVVRVFVAKARRPLLAELTFRAEQLAKFSVHAGLDTPAWDARSFAAGLGAAIDHRDQTAASDAFRTLAQSFEERFVAG